MLNCLFFLFLLSLSIDVFAHHSPKTPYSNDIDCLVDALIYEPHPDDIIDKMLIYKVIQNRIESDQYPNTACRVINQRFQFSYLLRKDLDRSSRTYQERFQKTKRLVLSFQTISSSFLNSFNDITHYFADGLITPPPWSLAMNVIATSEHHLFLGQ